MKKMCSTLLKIETSHTLFKNFYTLFIPEQIRIGQIQVLIDKFLNLSDFVGNEALNERTLFFLLDLFLC